MRKNLVQTIVRNCLWLLLTLILTISILGVLAQATLNSQDGTTVVKVVPESVELGPGDVVGEEFTVAVVVEDVSNLYGFDIQFSWNTTYLEYVNHTATIPVEDYPDVIDPSPYAGILHSPGMLIKNVVDEAGVSGAVAGTMYWLSFSSMAPAEAFEGDGTAFVMTFKVKSQPFAMDVNLTLHFVSTDIAASNGTPIEHTTEDGFVLLRGTPPPSFPTVTVLPTLYKHSEQSPSLFDVNVTILDLHQYWDIGGFNILLSFDPLYIEGVNLTIDPAGWWDSFWPEGTFELKKEIDNTAGIVWVAFVGLPALEGDHTPSSGTGCLFTVTFNGTTLGGGGGSGLSLTTDLAGFPHPERSESPWKNNVGSVPIPHNVTHGFYQYIETKVHTITWEQHIFNVDTESNSSISTVNFDQTHRLVEFNLTGRPAGYTGYCNITIPKELLYDSPENWLVYVDGQLVTSTVTEDENNAYLYFTYTLSTHYVQIMGTEVIPEFAQLLALVMLLAATIAVVLNKKLLSDK